MVKVEVVPVQPSHPLYPFLLTLSYWEKSEEELAKWKEVRKKSRVDNSQYDSVLGSYANHRRQAHAYLLEVRRAAAKVLPDEERELDELIGRLRKLARDAEKGRIKPDKANAESARIRAKLAVLQEEVGLHQIIVNAKHSNELGGRIVLPMDEYGVKIRRLGFTADPDRPMKEEGEGDRREVPYGLIALVLLAVAVVVFYPQVAGSVQMRYSMVNVGDQLVINCSNRGDLAAYFYAPWPEGVPNPQGMSPRGQSFGVRIHVREKSMNTWHLLPASEGAWYQQNKKLLESGPYVIEAGSRKVFELRLLELRTEGIDATATRIQIVNGRGRVVQEKILEQSRAAAPAPF